MSKRECVFLASRALSLIWIVEAFLYSTYLPERVHSHFHYLGTASVLDTTNYLATQYTITVIFHVLRVVTLILMATVFWRGGPKIGELLFPSAD
jgi:hypothetical protein